MSQSPVKIYFVLGEESGDALGADLFPALLQKGADEDRPVEIVGLAGTRLTSLGVKSLFDIEDISVMGITAVLARLPKIVRRIYQTVADIVAHKPDIIVLIDSPDFCHAVAKRVRKKLPETPIINYVCPSVWAWRTGRAPKMRVFVDHVLTILPFEPKELKRLGGPEGTYVGHPMARHIQGLQARQNHQPAQESEKPVLLMLPGSRRSEIKTMLPEFKKTVEILADRGAEFSLVLPAVSRFRSELVEQTSSWRVRPVVIDASQNDTTFANAHAALATSGTVLLQLALHRVPTVAGYKLDWFVRTFIMKNIKIWSSSLPNLIADRQVISDAVNEMVIPGRMARDLERLLTDTTQRRAQLEGFEEVIEAMKTERPTNLLSAEVIFDHLKS